MQSKNKRNPMIIKQAADWAVRLDGDKISTRDKRSCTNWLLESPTHIHEFLMACAILKACSKVDQQRRISIEDLLKETCSEVIPMAERISDRDAAVESSSVRKRWMRFGLAATGSLFILVGVVLSLAPGAWLGSKDKPTLYSTEIGEQRTVTLEDGSVILLNTLTSVETEFSKHRRDIHFKRGEAIFRVVKDSERPFTVFIDGMIVHAVGTEFNIYRNDDKTTVSVLHGKVSVRLNGNSKDGRESMPIIPDVFGPTTELSVASPDNSEHLLLVDGQQAVLHKTGLLETNHDADLEKALSWQFKTLILRADTLADVAQEFNRYNRRQIVIEDVALASLSISGVFKVDDPDSLVEFLIQLGMAEIKSSDVNRIVLVKAG